MASPDAAGTGVVESSLEMASAALEQLDREINGGAAASLKAPLAASNVPVLEIALWTTMPPAPVVSMRPALVMVAPPVSMVRV